VPTARRSASGELGDFGDEQDLLEQFVDTGALQGEISTQMVSPPTSRHESVFADLLEHAVGIGVGLIHLVHGQMSGTSAAWRD